MCIDFFFPSSVLLCYYYFLSFLCVCVCGVDDDAEDRMFGDSFLFSAFIPFIFLSIRYFGKQLFYL